MIYDLKVKTASNRINKICSFLTEVLTTVWFYAAIFIYLRFLTFIKSPNQLIAEGNFLKFSQFFLYTPNISFNHWRRFVAMDSIIIWIRFYNPLTSSWIYFPHFLQHISCILKKKKNLCFSFLPICELYIVNDKNIIKNK